MNEEIELWECDTCGLTGRCPHCILKPQKDEEDTRDIRNHPSTD